ncbi:tannase/feruloyl esterase family alpha/beta hydrolase [Kocuria rosea]|uniref:Tannase/feruloyl esterase family alpha/beta hydrolase n=1 Tax=Kocuria rosea TaxID=1275 RepID=A0A4R5YAJ3_KOCRO|nr:tannase/feruloyl esterase family alpha/beta hydrolase [Kocuria rosea]TDL41870.1 tannase/feruloyl esterase family alpha/beta hydrolase [Kocuria rosea]
MIKAQKIGTPDMQTGDATVTEAQFRPAAAAVTTDDGTAAPESRSGTSVNTPATPDFCQVTGEIAAVTEGAQPIGFQVNLPADWNGRSVQFGGAGLNGALTDASGYLPAGTTNGDVDSPLMRGYLTVGTDSGHLAAASPRAASNDPVEQADAYFDFALNEEMWRNFSTDAYKKVHDVGEELSKAHYGKKPKETFWFGTSEGGREGLLMAQRFPKDIDNIFVAVPVIGWSGLFNQFIETVQAVERNSGAGAFTAADIDLLATVSAQACDGQDGIADGVLTDWANCQEPVMAAVDAKVVAEGAVAGENFSPAQFETIRTIFAPTDPGFELASGMGQYPGFLFGGESHSLQHKIGTDPSLAYGDQGYPVFNTFGVGSAKYVFAQDPDLDVVNDYDPADHRERIQEVSRDMDTVDPDLSAFQRHGGKLTILECTADYAQSPAMGMKYYDSVVKTMGQDQVDKFLRLYISPGTDHDCTSTIDPAALTEDGTTTYGAPTSAGTVHGVPHNTDWVTVMEDWALHGHAPGESVTATTNNPAAPFETLAAKPICHYPLHAQYTEGDPAQETSYRCEE